jgi:hypothetical protein
MVPSVQGVVPGSNVEELISTCDIPWTGVKDAVLYDALSSRAYLSGWNLGSVSANLRCHSEGLKDLQAMQ